MCYLYLLVSVSYLVSWTPYTILGCWIVFSQPKEVPVALLLCPSIFAKCSVVWNPIIYVGTNQQFRDAFLEICPCFKGLLSCCEKLQKSDSDEDIAEEKVKMTATTSTSNQGGETMQMTEMN